MTMLQTLIAMAVLMGAVSADAQVPLKMGTYLPESRTAPKLAIFPSDDGKWGDGGDICKQCLAGGPDIPRVCLVMLCAQPPLAYEKILVPPNAKEMIEKSCGVNRLCTKENFEVISGWPPKPGDPDPYERGYRQDQLTKPYKGFLELSRIDADKQLKTGALSKSDYKQIIKDYRADWKALRLAQ
jgi:hypothetical protein